MPKGKTSGPNDRNARYNQDSDFASVRLSRGDKDSFTAWFTGIVDDVGILFTELLADSYRISVKYDYNSRCVMCSLTQQDDKHHNRFLVVVSRASDAFEAVAMSYYKVFVMYPGERLPTDQADNSWG